MIILARFIVISMHSGPGVINDRLIIVIFLGEGGGLSTKNETSASAFRGRGVPEILLNCGRMWMGEGGGSYFRGFYVDVINVCSLIKLPHYFIGLGVQMVHKKLTFKIEKL